MSSYNGAEKKLKSFALLKGYNDPTVIGMSYSLLALNLIADYCKVGEEDALKISAMNPVIQGFRMCSTQPSQRHSWKLEKSRMESKKVLSFRILMWKLWEEHTEYC